jgi:hypothetical protein
MRCDLSFTLLVNFYFQASLARPLLSKVLIELVHVLVCQVLPFALDPLCILSLAVKEPVYAFITST